MKELVEYIAKSLVDDPSQVKVTEIEGNTSIIFELSVSPEETGRVIGLWAGEQRSQIGIGRLVTGGAVDAVERIQVNNLHAQRRKGPFVFRAARFDHVAQIAPALVVTAREGGYVGIIRDARAQVEHGDRFSGFALLADQTAAGIQRVIQVGREINMLHGRPQGVDISGRCGRRDANASFNRPRFRSQAGSFQMALTAYPSAPGCW